MHKGSPKCSGTEHWRGDASGLYEREPSPAGSPQSRKRTSWRFFGAKGVGKEEPRGSEAEWEVSPSVRPLGKIADSASLPRLSPHGYDPALIHLNLESPRHPAPNSGSSARAVRSLSRASDRNSPFESLEVLFTMNPQPRRSLGLLFAALLLPSGQVRGQGADLEVGQPGPTEGAPVTFVDVAAARGIASYEMMEGMAGGIAAADYDDDGDIDLFIPTANGIPNQLYRNLGNGNFEEIAAQVGLDETCPDRAPLWMDFDGDRDLDLLVFGDDDFSSCDPARPQSVRLYRQLADGTFQNVAGPEMTMSLEGQPRAHCSAMCVGDVNNDGFLDLYIAAWNGVSQLLLNNNGINFVNVTAASGIGTESNRHWQPMMHDFNRDGWLDIYVATDFQPNRLYINQRNGTFIDRAPEAGLDNFMNDMGMTMGDYDNDGDLDIYVTNIWEWMNRGEHNVLLRNDTVGSQVSFTDVAPELGVDQGYWGWGTTFFDADKDGWEDLVATNGFGDAPWNTDRSRFFLNTGGQFQDVSAVSGLYDEDWGSSLIALDYDRDGDEDLMQSCNLGGPIRLLENRTSTSNHYLNIKPRMQGPNHRAIGAIIKVTAGGKNMMRAITAGTSIVSQEPAEAFFGLGSATVADRVEIQWPDGQTTVWNNVVGDRIYTLRPEGRLGDLNMSGEVNIDDAFLLIAAAGFCFDCPEDLNGDSIVNINDLILLFQNWGYEG